jgi:hypothetical protein
MSGFPHLDGPVPRDLAAKRDIVRAEEITAFESGRGFYVVNIDCNKKKKKKCKDHNNNYQTSNALSVSLISQTMDTPLTTLGVVPVDGMYSINFGVVVKTTDSGGGTLTPVVNFTQIPSAGGLSSPITGSALAMSSLAGESYGSITSSEMAYLLAGTSISYSVTGGSYADGGSYDFFLKVQ